MATPCRLTCLLLLGVASSFANAKDAVKVFVLAGQSNMEGKGSIAHLRQVLNDTSTADTYRHLWDDDTRDWTQRDDIFISFNQVKQGNLTVGYGVPGSRFGVELQFGHVMGDAFGEKDKVLLIKCAWGGHALAVEFRPPSSGIGNYTKPKNRASGLKLPYKPLEYGASYREMIRIVQETVEDIGSVVPGYNDETVEIAGLVWFQGWNDMIDPKKTREYGENLANFIRNVRSDLDVPNMPVVVGELGQAGVEMPSKNPKYREKHVNFRSIQKGITEMEEFKSTTRFVKTSIYVVDDADSYDGDYHYYGRADTFFHIGNAFGEAMIPLVLPDEYEPSDEESNNNLRRRMAVKSMRQGQDRDQF